MSLITYLRTSAFGACLRQIQPEICWQIENKGAGKAQGTQGIASGGLLSAKNYLLSQTLKRRPSLLGWRPASNLLAMASNLVAMASSLKFDSTGESNAGCSRLKVHNSLDNSNYQER